MDVSTCIRCWSSHCRQKRSGHWFASPSRNNHVGSDRTAFLFSSSGATHQFCRHARRNWEDISRQSRLLHKGWPPFPEVAEQLSGVSRKVTHQLSRLDCQGWLETTASEQLQPDPCSVPVLSAAQHRWAELPNNQRRPWELAICIEGLALSSGFDKRSPPNPDTKSN